MAGCICLPTFALNLANLAEACFVPLVGSWQWHGKHIIQLAFRQFLVSCQLISESYKRSVLHALSRLCCVGHGFHRFLVCRAAHANTNTRTVRYKHNPTAHCRSEVAILQ
jgi:hypothetical protein